jgi:hypothetical protein
MLLYSSEPDALPATLRDVFGLKSVDAGDGWLIFALPPDSLTHIVREPIAISSKNLAWSDYPTSDAI